MLLSLTLGWKVTARWTVGEQPTERNIQGAMAEFMRAISVQKTPMAVLSRAVAGVRGRTLMINLPGSPKGVRECFAVVRPVLAHAVGLLAGRAHEDAK